MKKQITVGEVLGCFLVGAVFATMFLLRIIL